MNSVGIFEIFLLINTLGFTSGGEHFQFFLDIYDKLDPAWVYFEHRSINTKVKCASLCYQDEQNCAYFGYKAKSCYLLMDTVDQSSCSKEDCSNEGMKVYKVRGIYTYKNKNIQISYLFWR